MKTQDNKRAIDLAQYSLSKDISKKVSRGVLTTDFREFIKRKNNKDKEALVGSSLPFIVSASGVVLGVVTLGISSLTREIVGDPTFAANVINISKDAIKNMGALSIFNLSVPVVTAGLMNLKLKRKTERYNARFYSSKELEELRNDERANAFIKDLKDNKDDPSLDFAKNFITNTNLSMNTKKYNKELLLKLSEHRYFILLEDEEKEISSYDNFIKFLKKSSTSNGASKEFLESPKVQSLIDLFEDRKKGRKLVKKNN